MLSLRKIFWGIGVMFGVVSVQAQACDAILEQGLRNTYSQIDHTNMRSKVQNGVCTYGESGQSTGGSRNAGGNFGYGGYTIGFTSGRSRTAVSQAKNQYCGQNASDLSNESYHNVLSLLVDPQIVQAWSACRERGGLFLNAETSGTDLIIVTFQFQPIGRLTSTQLTADPEVIGARCSSSLPQRGSEITNVTYTTTCRRFGAGPVNLIVNTDFNSARLHVPRIVSIDENQQQSSSNRNRQSVASPPQQVVSVCLLPPPPGAPPGSRFANGVESCPYEGPAGQPCRCPIHDGVSGGPDGQVNFGPIVGYNRGRSVRPSDVWWRGYSSENPNAQRAQ